MRDHCTPENRGKKFAMRKYSNTNSTFLVGMSSHVTPRDPPRLSSGAQRITRKPMQGFFLSCEQDGHFYLMIVWRLQGSGPIGCYYIDSTL